MNEKTAEEKLRQTLEGNMSGDTAKSTPKRVVVRRINKPDSPAKVADSFMEDFEKKLEQSLNFGSVSSKKGTETSAHKIIIKSELSDDTPVRSGKNIKPRELKTKPAASFMEDFGKKLEQSLNFGSFSNKKDKKETETKIIIKRKLDVSDDTPVKPKPVEAQTKISEIPSEPIEVEPEKSTAQPQEVQQEIKVEEPTQKITSEAVSEPDETQNFEPVEEIKEEVKETELEKEKENLEEKSQPENIEAITEIEPSANEIEEPETQISEIPSEPIEVEPEKSTAQPQEVQQEIKVEEPTQKITSEAVSEPDETQNFEPVEEIKEEVKETELEKEKENLEEKSQPENIEAITEIEPSANEIEEPETQILETSSEPIESEPVIDAEIEQKHEEQKEPEAENSELPDIPLISENSENETDDETQSGLPDIPVVNADSENEFENVDTSGLENENLDGFEFEDEDLALDSGDDSETKSEEDFSPSADVVVNVDDEIPEQTPEVQPEGGLAPISVEMPEKTETAEDKLMADIAEAMTGTPVTLETREPVEPYKLPEDFLNEANKDPSQQTAENKLIANIAQAMSESTLDAAAGNAAQNFEDELDNLSNEDLASVFPGREEPLTEEIDLSAYEADEPEVQEPAPKVEDDEPEKPETEIESTFDESPLPEPVDEPEPEPAEEPDLTLAPIEEPADEETEEAPQEIEIESGPEIQEENQEQEIEAEPEPDIEPENLEVPETESLLSEPEPEPEIEEVSEPEIENEPEELQPEINLEPENQDEDDDSDSSFFDGLPDELLGAMSMPEESSEDESLISENSEPDVSSYSLRKNKSEQSLISESENENDENFEDVEESNDDFDINSLGEDFNRAIAAPSNKEPEFEPEPEIEEENDYGFDENSPSHGGFMTTDPGEEEEKNKVKDLRGRLAERGNSSIEINDDDEDENDNDNENSKSSGRIVTPLLLTALLGLGGFIAWQTMQFTNNLAGGLPNVSSSSASMPGSLNPSYEYAVDFIFDSNLSGRMAQRGKDGWKVASSRRTQDSITGQLGYEFIFLRENKN